MNMLRMERAEMGRKRTAKEWEQMYQGNKEIPGRKGVGQRASESL